MSINDAIIHVSNKYNLTPVQSLRLREIVRRYYNSSNYYINWQAILDEVIEVIKNG